MEKAEVSLSDYCNIFHNCFNQALLDTANAHVKYNRTCLEPCVRQLVQQIEELSVYSFFSYVQGNFCCLLIYTCFIEGIDLYFQFQSAHVLFSVFY